MNTFDAIKLRHSTRGFSDRQIPEQDLQDILVAGGQAAIGCADFDSLKLPLTAIPTPIPSTMRRR